MGDPFDSAFEGDDPEDRKVQEAEELMRQGRYRDAAGCYRDLRRFSPTDPWFFLGHASALECAGEVPEAQRLAEEAASHHRANVHVQRFCHMFYVRREDFPRAQRCRRALRDLDLIEEGPPDQLADLYFNQGRYHEAQAELERLLETGDVEFEDAELRASIHARLGACRRQMGELEGAREQLLTSLALDPGNHWTLSELAEVERSLGNPEGARRRYLEALVANPDDHWCRGHLAQLEHEMGDRSRAVALYEEVIAKEPRALWAKIELAQVLAEHDPTRSEELCQEVLRDDPAYPWAYTQLAVLARLGGDPQTGRKYLRQALQTAPTSTWILHDLADVNRQLGRHEEAAAHLEHARNLDPFDATTYGFTADLLRSEGRNREACSHLAKAVELEPEYAWAWRELSELRALAGDLPGAEEAFEAVERIEPDEAANYGLRAFILRRAGRRGEALPYLRRAVALQPIYPWAWRELVDLLMQSGRYADAESAARDALDHIPDHQFLLLQLADAQRHRGHREESLASVERAMALGEDAQLWAMRAELLLERDPPAALAAAQNAVRLDRGPEYLVILAQIQLACGSDEDARRTVAPLLERRRCPAGAWDLGAELAARHGDHEEVRELCHRGLAQHENDQRLRVRLADAEWRIGEDRHLRRLEGIFDVEARQVPWREVALLYAAAGDRSACRLACQRLVDLLRDRDADRARAWLFWAERELEFGQLDETRRLLDRALAHRPPPASARVLAAMLAERRGEYGAAIAELERLRDEHPARLDADTGEALKLRRQLASLHELAGHNSAADELWDSVLAHAGDLDDESLLHAARHLRLRGRVDEADALLRERLATIDAEPLRGDLLHELALLEFHRGGVGAALATCERNQGLRHHVTGLLQIQLLILAGRPGEAEDATHVVPPDGDGDRGEARRLRTRALMAQQKVHAAMIEARTLLDADPGDESAACLLAECQVFCKEPVRALATLEAPSLPTRCSHERLFLGAALQLELHDQERTLAWLAGRRDEEVPDAAPLARLFAAAWPRTWWPEAGDEVEPRIEDIPAFPPLPRAAARLAGALGRAGHPLRAAEVAGIVAVAIARHDQPASSRELHRVSVRHWLRAGRRGMALRAAIRARAPLAFLRCLAPF